jgi:UDPglucose 6-dehydrogenase
LANVLIVGLGYVGLASAVGLASLGHSVVGVDTNKSRIAQLNSGKLPIHEPGLEEAMTSAFEKGTLSVIDSIEQIEVEADYAFICVPTPSGHDGGADLSYVESAIKDLISKLSKGSIVVLKSTLPIGTGARFSKELENLGIEVASNPEFLQEGTALLDFHVPSRIVVGANDDLTAQRVMDLYETVEAPRFTCGLSSAETIKHASNSFLALRLSFVNELAELCERTGAKISEVTEGMALDSRIGNRFLNPGPGWGGSCFPKDTLELAHSARSLGFEMSTVEAAISSNQRATKTITSKVSELVGKGLNGTKIAIWGLAFKANTDDTRDSPAMSILEDLVSSGAAVTAYDEIAKNVQPKGFVLANSALEACVGAEVLLVLTESQEYKTIDPKRAAALMSKDAVVFDTRRILDRDTWNQHFNHVKTLGN